MADRISRVRFGILSAEEILARSACEVTTVELYSGGAPVPGGLYDLRMGVVDFGDRCETCKHDNRKCPGHPGHLVLAAPVYNDLFIPHILKSLRCTCLECSSLLVPEARRRTILRMPAEARLTKCVNDVARYCPVCQTESHTRVAWDKAAVGSFVARYRDDRAVTLRTDDVHRVLAAITDADALAMGFRPPASRPESMVFTIMPIPPVTVRPSARAGTQRRDDDLTSQLSFIIKQNALVRARVEAGAAAEMVAQAVDQLQILVIQFLNNTAQTGAMQARMKSTNRPLNSLAMRLKGKNGRVRYNLLGKRVSFSARSVITPDPNISLEELGVPARVAMTITFPERVHERNLERLQRAVYNGPAEYPGARFLLRDGASYSLQRPEKRSTTVLQVGDTVERHMIDGDYVLFNRQPSLHRLSLMCHRVRVLPYDTFRLNVITTGAYNADFDGDEMNLHAPQSETARVEISRLANVGGQILSPGTHAPAIGAVQDVALGVHIITLPETRVPTDIAMNACTRMNRSLPSFADTAGAGKTADKTTIAGAEALQMVFGKHLHASVGDVEIDGGRLVAGTCSKKTYQAASTGVVHTTFADDGSAAIVRLLDGTQDLVCAFFAAHGFSMGARDLVIRDAAVDEIGVNAAAAVEQVDRILASVHDGTFANASVLSDGEALEKAVRDVLQATKDKAIAISIAECRHADSRLIKMIDAGSKGNKQNVVQMCGMLGQQQIENKRVPVGQNDRTLPHFRRFDDRAPARGFVQNSFVRGLDPHEYFFHAVAGREGLINTAVSTAETGYIQRKLVKALEDLRVHYDGSVRNSAGILMQRRYGDDGMDSCSIEHQTLPQYEFGDVATLAAEFLMDAAADAGETRLGAALMRAHLSPKRLIRAGCTRSALDTILAKIAKRARDGRVAPSEMVGVIAAQSIAEPSTQMVLDSFHSTGIGSAKSGIPRVRDLINVAKSVKDSTVTVYLQAPLRQSLAVAKRVRDLLQETRVRDVVARAQVVYEPSSPGQRTFPTDEDAKLHDLYTAFSETDLADMPFVLRLELDPESVETHGVTTMDIHAALQTINGHVVCSTATATKPVVRIYLNTVALADDAVLAEVRHAFDAVFDIRVKGIPGIGRATILDAPYREYDAAAADYVAGNEYAVVAMGSDVADVFSIDGVDKRRTDIDSLCDVYAFFGVEAARELILRGLMAAFSGDTYANYRHISLLVDYMTHRGDLLSINRYGINHGDSGPLARCSFEQTVQELTSAAALGKEDDMTGVSANIMFGQVIPCGTGVSDVLIDPAEPAALPDGEVLPSKRPESRSLALNVAKIAPILDLVPPLSKAVHRIPMVNMFLSKQTQS